MRGHGEDNQNMWKPTKIPSQKKHRLNWVYNEPRKPPPMRNTTTLHTTGLKLVPGSSTSEPHLLGRGISTIFEK